MVLFTRSGLVSVKNQQKISVVQYEMTFLALACVSRAGSVDQMAMAASAGTELSYLGDSQLNNKPDNNCNTKECLLSIIIQSIKKNQSGSDFVVQSLDLMDWQKRHRADYGRPNRPFTWKLVPHWGSNLMGSFMVRSLSSHQQLQKLSNASLPSSLYAFVS